jgi:fructokinase
LAKRENVDRIRDSAVTSMRIGVDLGGTKIEIAALDAGGRIVLRERFPSPLADYDATVRAVRDGVLKAEAELGAACSVGLGIPGTISPATGLVKNANSTWLNGKPFDVDVAEALNRPIRMANDANCFALSEAADGAGKDKRVVFGAILGTGVGGGIAVDARILTGPNAVAGEWGHNPLPWADPSEKPGPLCFCGKHGCIETWLSGPGLAADFAHAAGRQSIAAEIAVAASRGDVQAEAALARYETRLAKALAHLVNILDPDIIVLGGGLSNLDRLYTNVFPQLAHYAFSDTIKTPIMRNRWGDSSGVRGAAWLWPGSVR